MCRGLTPGCEVPGGDSNQWIRTRNQKRGVGGGSVVDQQKWLALYQTNASASKKEERLFDEGPETPNVEASWQESNNNRSAPPRLRPYVPARRTETKTATTNIMFTDQTRPVHVRANGGEGDHLAAFISGSSTQRRGSSRVADEPAQNGENPSHSTPDQTTTVRSSGDRSSISPTQTHAKKRQGQTAIPTGRISLQSWQPARMVDNMLDRYDCIALAHRVARGSAVSPQDVWRVFYNNVQASE